MVETNIKTVALSGASLLSDSFAPVPSPREHDFFNSSPQAVPAAAAAGFFHARQCAAAFWHQPDGEDLGLQARQQAHDVAALDCPQLIGRQPEPAQRHNL